MLLSRRQFAALTTAWLARPAGAIPPRPKLFVLFVAEQFRADYLTRFSPLFGAGGLRRMMEEGAWFPDCRIAASSFSASALATIATGAWADAHGIVAESWYDRSAKKVVSAAADLDRATTLADQIALTGPRNRVFSMAWDAQHAGLLVSSGPLARLEHGLVTGEPASGEPQWMESFRSSHNPNRFKGASWRALQAEPGAPPLRVLVDDPKEFLSLYQASPYGQDDQFELARAIITEEKLGQGPGLDFLAVTLNGMANLAYETGAESPLMVEMALHLDRQIEATLEALRKTLGAGGFGVAFTAAHGAVEQPAEAIDGSEVAGAIDQGLSDAFDIPGLRTRFLERYVYPFVYLDHAQLRTNGVDPARARRVAGEAALRAPGVIAYCTSDGQSSRSGDWKQRFLNSMHGERSGDVMLAYEANSVERYGSGRGISYGSLYTYDTQVPLLFYGSQFRPVVDETPVQSVDLAPTLARALRVAAPSSSTGRVLDSAFAPDVKAGR